MIYILIGTVLLLCAIIIALGADLKKSRRKHQQKVVVLKEMIVHLLNDQQQQSTKVRLSEELKDKLQAANRTISNDVLILVHDFIDTLSKNDLLKK